MNLEPIINTVKNHELVILEGKELRELLGIKRLTTDVVNELSEELGLLGYVIIPIRYGSRHNGLTDVKKAVIIRKTTYLKIVRERDMYSMAGVIIDYVMSNKQLFEINIRSSNNTLKLPASIIRRILRYIGLSNNYLDNHMNSIVMLIRIILETNKCETKLKRAMGKMGSVIYIHCGQPSVTEAGKRFLNPPARSVAGEKHVGNPTWSNPNKIRTGEKEGTNHEELKVAGAGPNGTVGTTPRVRGSMGREGKRDNYVEVENNEGGWSRTNGKARGGGE